MTPVLAPAERLVLRSRCTTHYPGHKELSPTAEFTALARWCESHDITADRYGDGVLINGFEAKVAALLGKPAAVFLPTGKMAQLIALKIHTERARLPRFGMHPTSHLELHEARAYAALLQLHGVLLGRPDQPILADDLHAVTDPLSCLLLELPMRECGGLLPSWEGLVELTSLARARGISLHMDGARLWECGAYYAPHSYAEIAALFDSVYVSFYKGINGVSGALLLGDDEFIRSARTWQVRFGGQLPQQTAAVASAAMRFDTHLAGMPTYLARARSLAAALSALKGVRVLPTVPQSNMMHVLFDCNADLLARERDALAQRDGIWAMGTPLSANNGTAARIEWYVGENLMAVDDVSVVATLAGLLERVRALG